MTVAELIEQLKDKDQTKRVLTRGYESGWCDVATVGEVTVALDVNTEWYYGPHEEADSGGRSQEGKTREAAITIGE